MLLYIVFLHLIRLTCTAMTTLLLQAPILVHGQTLNFDKLRSYEQVLNDVSAAYAPIATADANTVLATCTSRYPCASGSTSNPAQSFNFTIIDDELPTAFAQIVLPNHDTLNTTHVIAGCRIAQMEPTWKKYLDNTIPTIPRGELFYQYYATSDNVFGTYPQLSWQCSSTTPYIPTLRPYYVSATTGPKDLVIVIDVSAAQTRLADAKTAANALLDTLSFYDYVAVVTIGYFANTSITPVPQRATISRVAEIKNKVNALTTVTDAVSSDPVEGMRAAVQLLITGEHAVSGCTQTVVLITSGVHEYTSTISLEDFLRPYTQLIFFALVVEVSGGGGSTTESGLKHVLRAACQQHGLVSKSQSASDVLQSLDFYPSYFASMKRNSTRVSWSEVYEDAFGQGLILSASRPQYESASNTGSLTGMFVLDAPISAVVVNPGGTTPLTQAQQVDTINTELLSSSQTCNVLDEAAFKSLASKLVAMQDKTGYECANLLASDSNDNPKALLPLWAILGVLIFYLLWVPCVCLMCSSSREVESEAVAYACCLWVLIVIFWPISLGLFFGISYGQFIDQNPRQSVKYTPVRHSTNPYRCCDVSCDGCVNGDTSLQECAYLSTSLLLEGECRNGYHCCQEDCYCDSYSDEGCDSTFCECISTVQHRLCRSACGTCYRPTVFASYDYTDSSSGTTHRHTALFSATCGRDDQNCVSNFQARYPINEEKDGWVDPADLSVLYTENVLKQGPIVAWGILSALAVLCSIGLVVVVWRCTKHIEKKKKPEPAQAPHGWPSHRPPVVADPRSPVYPTHQIRTPSNSDL